MIKYLTIMFGCGFIATKFVKNKDKFKFVSVCSTIALYLLILTMGLRIGSNEEVINGLATIGVQALITVIMAIGGSMIMTFVFRKILGINRHAQKKGAANTETEKEGGQQLGIKSSLTILSIAAVGMLLGYFVILKVFDYYDEFAEFAGNFIDILLCFMLGFVGFDLGMQGHVIQKFKEIGIKVLMLPIAILIGTLGTALIYGLASDLSIKESLAIFAGMGWYSFAPAAILEAGYVKASAISFLHNLFREVFSLLFIPFFAGKIGYLEAASMAGSPGMDCCLPTVEKSTNAEAVIYSLISGIILSILVPIIVPLIINS